MDIGLRGRFLDGMPPVFDAIRKSAKIYAMADNFKKVMQLMGAVISATLRDFDGIEKELTKLEKIAEKRETKKFE